MRKPVDLLGWALIPGPVSDPPGSSLDLHDLVEHSPQIIANAILSFPGMTLENASERDWWDWSARWSVGERHIRVGMTLFEAEPLSWGGSPLFGHCELFDILGLWQTVRDQCPGIWMHNDECEILTPDLFRRRFDVEED